MSKYLILALLLAGVGVSYFRVSSPGVQEDAVPVLQKDDIAGVETKKDQSVPREAASHVTYTMFVPYWSDIEDIATETGYSRYVYFGISPTEKGVLNIQEDGYRSIERFVSAVPAGTETQLAVRMLDKDINKSILQDEDSWDTLIEESMQVAQSYEFDTVALDLEVGLLAMGSYTSNIPDFIARFSDVAGQRDFRFVLMMYGDVFYRNRPYDIEKIAPLVDEMMIMTYDFTKSFGNPGPNFPLGGEEKYGYDMDTMVDDFLTYLPADKVSVVLGMYGYEWKVDEENRPLKQAKAVTLNQVQSRYLSTCEKHGCIQSRDDLSTEGIIKFEDESGYTHVVWYEDQKSLEAKIAFLQAQGISKVGYWAYGYGTWTMVDD